MHSLVFKTYTPIYFFNSLTSVSIHNDGFLLIGDLAFQHSAPPVGHLMSPLPSVCLNLHVRTNLKVHFEKKLILKFNSLLKLTNQWHLLLSLSNSSFHSLAIHYTNLYCCHTTKFNCRQILPHPNTMYQCLRCSQ